MHASGNKEGGEGGGGGYSDIFRSDGGDPHWGGGRGALKGAQRDSRMTITSVLPRNTERHAGLQGTGGPSYRFGTADST